MSLHVEKTDLEMTLLPLPNFMLKYHNTHYTDTGMDLAYPKCWLDI